MLKTSSYLRRDRCGISPLKSGDRIVSDPQSKANVFSDYFKSVLLKSHLKTHLKMNGDSLPTLPPLTFSCDGIQQFLQQLNPNKASGQDNIPIILKECADQIAPLANWHPTDWLADCIDSVIV